MIKGLKYVRKFGGDLRGINFLELASRSRRHRDYLVLVLSLS